MTINSPSSVSQVPDYLAVSDDFHIFCDLTNTSSESITQISSYRSSFTTSGVTAILVNRPDSIKQHCDIYVYLIGVLHPPILLVQLGKYLISNIQSFPQWLAVLVANKFLSTAKIYCCYHACTTWPTLF